MTKDVIRCDFTQKGGEKMDPEKIGLFKSGIEAPVVDIEKDKQEILKNLERELANKQQELAVLEPELYLAPTEELTAKKSQLEQEIEAIKTQKLALVQEAASQSKSMPETFLEKTNKELDDIGEKYNTKIADAKAQSQADRSIEQSVGQFETSDQLEEEATRNDKQIKKMTVEAVSGQPGLVKETPVEKKSVLTEMFFNPEAENRIKEIQAELNREKEEIQALEEAIVEKKQKVKSLEGEKDKLEQGGLAAFFRNAPKLETANKRGATAVTRGMAISELHAALEKYDKIQDQSFMEKIMKKLSAKMKKLFRQAYPELFPKKEKVERVKKSAKVKKAKSAIQGKRLVGDEGMSIA